MTVSGGSMSEVYTEVTMQYRLMRDQRDHHSDYVNEIKVQNVVEERYSTIYQQDATKSAHSFHAVK
jgi:Cdc6-like AAA superfamily ATPase